MSSEALRLADHFPRATKPCKKAAKIFFDCFSEAGLKYHDESDGSSKMVEECADLMKVYDKCMVRDTSKRPQQLIRVQDEYRVKKDPKNE